MLTMKTLGKFCESILDTDFDIKEEDINIGNIYTIRAQAGLLMTGPGERLLRKDFDKFVTIPRDCPHVKGNSFGTATCERYFVDWLCSLPSSYVDDTEFTARKPRLMQKLSDYDSSGRFDVILVKMKDRKDILFRWAKTKSSNFETFLTVKLL